MNFARFCFTLATFPTRYAFHRIGQTVENALWSEDFDTRMRAAAGTPSPELQAAIGRARERRQAASLDHANARTSP